MHSVSDTINSPMLFPRNQPLLDYFTKVADVTTTLFQLFCAIKYFQLTFLWCSFARVFVFNINGAFTK